VLLGATLAVGAFALLIPYLGPLSGLFGFVPLPWPLLATALGIVAAYVACTEAVKTLAYRFGTTAAASLRKA
jgi:Mg2+-importing ATPase